MGAGFGRFDSEFRAEQHIIDNSIESRPWWTHCCRFDPGGLVVVALTLVNTCRRFDPGGLVVA